MINVKKGTALGLSQSDFVGTVNTGEGVVAGMLVNLNSSGQVVKSGAAASATITDAVNTNRYGFAINNQTDGDVIESGKIGVYSLDGNSVIETDQTAATVTLTNYPLGSSVCPAATNTGQVRALVANGKTIGTVDGIRSIHGTALLAIKLAA